MCLPIGHSQSFQIKEILSMRRQIKHSISTTCRNVSGGHPHNKTQKKKKLVEHEEEEEKEEEGKGEMEEEDAEEEGEDDNNHILGRRKKDRTDVA